MVQKFILDNGATVLVDEMQDVRSLALGILRRRRARARSARRGRGSPISSSTSSSSGPAGARPSRSPGRSTGSGGDVDAFTTKEYTGFYAHTLDIRFDEALDLLGDIVLSPAFEAVDIEVERGVILEEIGEANDNPDDLVHEMFVRSFWRSHPLGAPDPRDGRDRQEHRPRRPLPLLPLPVHARQPDHLGRRARPGRGVPRRGREAVPAAPRPASSAARRRRRRTGGRPRGHQHLQLKSRRGLEQVHVCLGVEGPGQASERRFAANLLDIVLGGGMSSRLFQEVREKRGLAYSVASSLNSYRLGGYETIYSACAPKNLGARHRGHAPGAQEAEARRRPAAGARLGQGEPEGQHDPRARVDRLAHVRRRRGRSSTSTGSRRRKSSISRVEARDGATTSGRRRSGSSTGGSSRSRSSATSASSRCRRRISPAHFSVDRKFFRGSSACSPPGLVFPRCEDPVVAIPCCRTARASSCPPMRRPGRRAATCGRPFPRPGSSRPGERTPDRDGDRRGHPRGVRGAGAHAERARAAAAGSRR